MKISAAQAKANIETEKQLAAAGDQTYRTLRQAATTAWRSYERALRDSRTGLKTTAERAEASLTADAKLRKYVESKQTNA